MPIRPLERLPSTKPSGVPLNGTGQGAPDALVVPSLPAESNVHPRDVFESATTSGAVPQATRAPTQLGAASPWTVATLADALSRASEGLLFVSESDHPYEVFHAELDPAVPLTASVLRRLLSWEPSAPEDCEATSEHFALSLRARDDFFLLTEEDILGAGLSSDEVQSHMDLESIMASAFVPTKIVNAERELETGKIFTATIREGDAVDAPYYVFGRLPTGDLVGLKSFRIWT